MIEVEHVDSGLVTRVTAVLDVDQATVKSEKHADGVYYTISGRNGIASASGATCSEALGNALDRWECLTVAV